MSVVSSILFGIGATIALMTIWTSYRTALPAFRRLKRQIEASANPVCVRKGEALGQRLPPARANARRHHPRSLSPALRRIENRAA
ncbi:hypothetical protein [Novosphingobium sp. ZW T3_23]|uniref:hypothetical protein n=1 Tax=Novosphingobium sp. ZW T3_23 TaxID=3378084 RepID=UPI003852780C